MKITKRQVKAFIKANPSLFVPGCEFPEETFTRFGITTPATTGDYQTDSLIVSRHELKKLKVQSVFNQVLSEKGMHMARHNFTGYKLKQIEQIPARIASYHKEAANKSVRGATLARGLATYGGVICQPETGSIFDHPTQVAERTAARV